MKRLNSALRCSAMAALTVTSGTVAQQVHAQSPESRSLEEVIVTATRRAEVLEDVPMSISVVTAEALETSGVTSIHDIAQVASGVQVNWAGAFTQPAIRGVTSLTNGYGENNVAIYVDGFYEGSTVAINQDLVNIHSIQVLKGPQGALYGRNATGGAILVETLAPSDTTTGSAEVTYARFDDKRFKGYISGPLSEMFSYSIAGYYRESDGWLDFADPAVFKPATVPAAAMPTQETPAPIEQRSVRAKLQGRFSDDFTATLAYNYGYSDVVNGNLYTTYAYRPGFIGPAPPVGQVAYNYGTVQLAETNMATLKLVWDTSLGTLTSYSGYTDIENPLNFDFDGTYADLTYSTSVFLQETTQQTFDFAITEEKFDLIVGASYINDDTHVDPDRPAINYGPNRAPATITNQGIEAEAWAAYFDGTYRLNDKWSLSAGGRYTDETKTAYYGQFVVAANGYPAFPPTTKEMSFSKFTPRASIRYELAPQTNIYASYSEGFRSGTLSLSGAASPALWLPVDPEVVDAYEIGFKTARDNVRFDIAAFFYDDQDLHVSVIKPDPRCASPVGCTVLTVFQNAEAAEIYGVDGNLTVSPAEDLNLRLGAAWIHARYTDFPNASGTGLNPATNLNVSGLIQNWNDQEMARAPEFSANFGADYNWQLPFGSLLMATNVSYSDSYVINNPSLFGGTTSAAGGGLPAGAIVPGTDQRYRQDSLTLVNASLTWTDPDGHFSIGVFGNNLTDEEYRVTYSGTSSFGDYGTMAEPQTYGMRLGYKF